MRNAARLLVLALIAGPVFSPAQKKDDLLQIQRDVASLAEDVKDLQKSQKSQDDKMEAMRVLLQQAVAASAQVSQDMAALQRNLTASVANTLSDQQSKISGAVAPLGSQMDGLASSVNALTQTVGQMNMRMDKIDTRLKDLSDKVSILNQPIAAPPPSVVPPPSAAAPDPNALPPGTTRLSLQQDAERDYASGYDDMALMEFANYIKNFHDDAYAPNAGYMIGMIYLLHLHDYESAAEAFQKVIDTYPGMNKSQDALYQKARALQLGGHKTDAIAAYQSFIKSYPANDYVPQAQAELKKLTTPAGARGNGKGRGAVK
ncbi:MAG TPA: tetratricopeptide repeat protein [Bryobacteraceae bacterium]|jgi:TolA-binding protein